MFLEARQWGELKDKAVRHVPPRMCCIFSQVHMGATRPQVPVPLLLRAINGTDRASHSLLNPSSITAIDLLLDLLLQLELMHPCHILTKLELRGVDYSLFDKLL